MRRFLMFFVFSLLLTLPCFASFGDGLFSGLKDIAGFIGRLIVPEQEYFHNQLASLSSNFNSRFGGISYLFQMIHSFLQSLSSVGSSEFIFSIPDNFYYSGYDGFSVNALSFVGPYVGLLRNVFSASFCIITAISCYHKLRTFFNG